MKIITSITLLTTNSILDVAAWAPAPSGLKLQTKLFAQRDNFKLNNEQYSQLQQFDFPELYTDNKTHEVEKGIAPLAAASLLGLIPLPAAAAGDQIPSAIAAYGHYLSLLGLVGLITYERCNVEAGMSKEKEMNLAIADIGTGVCGVGILVSGYYRATQYGKGWDFYSHEPIFWLKMVFLCIFGAATLFPTTTFIKRSVAIQTGKELEPMSEKLANRLKQVLNAELVMVVSIPLAATLMVRYQCRFFVAS